MKTLKSPHLNIHYKKDIVLPMNPSNNILPIDIYVDCNIFIGMNTRVIKNQFFFNCCLHHTLRQKEEITFVDCTLHLKCKGNFIYRKHIHFKYCNMDEHTYFNLICKLNRMYYAYNNFNYLQHKDLLLHIDFYFLKALTHNEQITYIKTILEDIRIGGVNCIERNPYVQIQKNSSNNVLVYINSMLNNYAVRRTTRDLSFSFENLTNSYHTIDTEIFRDQLRAEYITLANTHEETMNLINQTHIPEPEEETDSTVNLNLNTMQREMGRYWF